MWTECDVHEEFAQYENTLSLSDLVSGYSVRDAPRRVKLTPEQSAERFGAEYKRAYYAKNAAKMKANAAARHAAIKADPVRLAAYRAMKRAYNAARSKRCART